MKTKEALLALACASIFGVFGCADGGGGGDDASSGGGEATSVTVGGQEVTSVSAPSTTVNLTSSPGSDASGTATLTETPGGLEVRLDVQNLIGDQIGAQHAANIHEGGTCADDRAGNGAPVRYPLSPVITAQDGTGTSTSLLQGGLALDQLSTDPPKYINVLAAQTGDETPPGISCADLSSGGGGSTPGAAE